MNCSLEGEKMKRTTSSTEKKMVQIRSSPYIAGFDFSTYQQTQHASCVNPQNYNQQTGQTDQLQTARKTNRQTNYRQAYNLIPSSYSLID
jgi:hypothetical protein